MNMQQSTKKQQHLWLLFIRSLTVKISADLLRQDCADVVWLRLIDSDQTIQQSSDSDSNVAESWLVLLTSNQQEEKKTGISHEK